MKWFQPVIPRNSSTYCQYLWHLWLSFRLLLGTTIHGILCFQKATVVFGIQSAPVTWASWSAMATTKRVWRLFFFSGWAHIVWQHLTCDFCFVSGPCYAMFYIFGCMVLESCWVEQPYTGIPFKLWDLCWYLSMTSQWPPTNSICRAISGATFWWNDPNYAQLSLVSPLFHLDHWKSAGIEASMCGRGLVVCYFQCSQEVWLGIWVRTIHRPQRFATWTDQSCFCCGD